MTPKARERMASMLLDELKADTKEEWWYLSIVNTITDRFIGGYLLQGKGPTDAWLRAHGLKIIPLDCETMTHGPVCDEALQKIPASMRYRLLTKEEAEKLGT